MLLYVHRNRRFIRDGSPGRPPRLWSPGREPRTSTSTFTQLLSSDGSVLKQDSSDASVLKQDSSDASVLKQDSSDGSVLKQDSSDGSVLKQDLFNLSCVWLFRIFFSQTNHSSHTVSL